MLQNVFHTTLSNCGVVNAYTTKTIFDGKDDEETNFSDRFWDIKKEVKENRDMDNNDANIQDAENLEDVDRNNKYTQTDVMSIDSIKVEEQGDKDVEGTQFIDKMPIQTDG